MKSAASVDGRTLTGAYRTSASVYGCGWPYSKASQKVPPEGFEPSHLAPEASALSPELWGLTNAERLPVRDPSCDKRAPKLAAAATSQPLLSQVTGSL